MWPCIEGRPLNDTGDFSSFDINDVCNGTIRFLGECNLHVEGTRNGCETKEATSPRLDRDLGLLYQPLSQEKPASGFPGPLGLEASAAVLGSSFTSSSRSIPDSLLLLRTTLSCITKVRRTHIRWSGVLECARG